MQGQVKVGTEQAKGINPETEIYHYPGQAQAVARAMSGKPVADYGRRSLGIDYKEYPGGTRLPLTSDGPPDHLSLSMAIDLGKNEVMQLIEEIRELRNSLSSVLAQKSEINHPPRGTAPTFCAAAAEVSDLVVSIQAARALVYEISAQLDL